MQTMRILTFILFLLSPSLLFSQAKPFEIFGSISGEYYSKVYLFFDGNYKQRDSLSSEIKDGRFYFKGSVSMPVLARLSLDDQNSFIADLYIDDNKTSVACTNEIKTYKAADNKLDTMNIFKLTSVHGSQIEDLKSKFNNWLAELMKSQKTDEEKQDGYYLKLTDFVKQHPKSRLSPYLVGNATTLYFHQVQELSNLYDASLRDSYEGKNVTKLMERLDKSKRSTEGVLFHDFVLKDTSGHDESTKELRGKYTLIVFWASWCGPCRAEHPELNRLYEQYKNKGLAIVGISIDEDRDKWAKAVSKDKLQWPQFSDLKRRSGIGDYYGLIETGEGIPFNILLDKDGRIIDKKVSLEHLETILEGRL
jgi:thiol-disulfide isomerase/thioredoxin